jgi:phage terminase small subunit
LSEGARRHFLDLIDALAPTHFRGEDITLLCAYCAAADMAETAAREMALPSGFVTNEGRPSPWFAIYTGAVKTMGALSLRLRISPQSRVAKASKKQTPVPMSYYERERMRGRGDDR